MKIFIIAAVTIFSVFLTQARADTDRGTKNLQLSNVQYSCININKENVDYWILSARAPKNNTFWKDTTGVGVRVDVQLVARDGGSHFPAAAAIDVKDIDAKVIRAALSLHVLDQVDLWDSAPSSVTRTTSVNLPVNFVRRQGTSDSVKVIQALINFTNTSTAGVPPNPYSKGAQLFGQFFNILNTTFTPDPKEIVDPNFQLSFGLGRVDAGCQDIQLHQGVGVQITDYDGSEADGIIKVSDANNYCFYKLNDDRDPDIGFSKKSGDSCSATIPANVKVLQNPQFIWLAYGTCKDDQNCTTTKSRANPKAEKIRSAVALCKSVGIGKDKCLKNGGRGR
jgi:hypothetical protein